jgi:hypothetical protein
MKTTLYFNYTRKRQDRAQIKEEWIEFVIENLIVPKFEERIRIRFLRADQVKKLMMLRACGGGDE